MSVGSTSEPPPDGASSEPLPPFLSDVLATLWNKRRSEVVNDLERLITLLGNQSHNPSVPIELAESIALAHQLHGAFGVFGLTTLKERFGIIEQMLVSDDVSTLDLVASRELIAAVRTVLANLP